MILLMNKSDLQRCEISCCGSPQNCVFVFFPPELNFAVKIAVQNEVGEGVVDRLESVCVNRPSVR
jgi:hypothetical protein